MNVLDFPNATQDLPSRSSPGREILNVLVQGLVRATSMIPNSNH